MFYSFPFFIHISIYVVNTINRRIDKGKVPPNLSTFIFVYRFIFHSSTSITYFHISSDLPSASFSSLRASTKNCEVSTTDFRELRIRRAFQESAILPLQTQMALDGMGRSEWSWEQHLTCCPLVSDNIGNVKTKSNMNYLMDIDLHI